MYNVYLYLHYISLFHITYPPPVFAGRREILKAKVMTLNVFLFSIHLSLYLSLNLSIYLSIYLSIFIYLSTHHSFSPSISPSTYLSIYIFRSCVTGSWSWGRRDLIMRSSAEGKISSHPRDSLH